ncbi:hypothetical protein [Rossellomorea sp. BNER]|uniref:hypothetical protein n=1 Tax=Rossellomorea sp. BNER TaxID=2962031 RepID=UPI003AF2E8E2|nr:hypothetical protein [Rossellomorea sp. BNER]
MRFPKRLKDLRYKNLIAASVTQGTRGTLVASKGACEVKRNVTENDIRLVTRRNDKAHDT